MLCNSRLGKLSVLLAVSSYLFPAYAADEPVEFNLSFLQGTSDNPKALRSLSGIIEGRYLARVIVNGKARGRHELVISRQEEQADKFCFQPSFWQKLNVQLTQEAQVLTLTPEQCVDLSQLEFASVDFDITQPLLEISIPQGYVDSLSDAMASDHGISGARLNYRLNANLDSEGERTAFGSIDSRLNLFDWVVHTDMVSFWNGDETESDISTLYATHALTSIGADVVVGKGYTRGELIDSFPFGGVGLTSNRLMSDSTSSFIPDISGIANSTSQITVRQHGRLVYSETVTPGPYKIDDFSVYGSGDLEVEIKDANGRIERKIYPLVTMPSLLRESYSEYSIAVGKRHDEHNIEGLFDSDRNFLFAEGSYGFPAYTLSGAALFDSKYQSLGLGSTFYLQSFGTLSLEGGLSFAEYDNGEDLNGFTFGAEYAYQFTQDTDLQLAAYRCRDEDYVTYASFHPEELSEYRQRQKHRLQAVLSTRFDDFYVSFQGWQQSYWDEDHSDIGATLSMNTQLWERLGTSLSLSYSDSEDISASLMFSLPLHYDDQYHTFSTSFTGGNNSDFAMTSSVSGSLSDDVSYSASAGGYGVNTDLAYRHDVAQLQAGVNYYEGTTSVSLGASGSLVWTEPSGLMAARSHNDTVAVVDMGGIEDVRVNGARTDGDGFAVVSVQPYQDNTLNIDVSTIPIDAEIDIAYHKVRPTEGAIVYQQVDARRVFKYTLRVKDSEGNKFDSGDVYNGDFYLGTIAPNGIVTIAMNEQLNDALVDDGASSCRINLSSAAFNVAKLSEVTCE